MTEPRPRCVDRQDPTVPPPLTRRKRLRCAGPPPAGRQTRPPRWAAFRSFPSPPARHEAVFEALALRSTVLRPPTRPGGRCDVGTVCHRLPVTCLTSASSAEPSADRADMTEAWPPSRAAPHQGQSQGVRNIPASRRVIEQHPPAGTGARDGPLETRLHAMNPEDSMGKGAASFRGLKVDGCGMRDAGCRMGHEG